MSKKIVVLDGYPLNPGDLSWDSLRALLPNVEIHERTSAGDVLSRCADAEIILTNKVRLSAETLRELPKLRYIGVLATGFDVVDAVVARTQDIVVCNIPAYGTRSVVQLVFAYILHWSNAVASHAVRVRGGAWTQSPDWSFWDSPLHELAGKTLGIIGFGRIGQQAGRIGHAFGMKIAAATRSSKIVDYPVSIVPMNELFSISDFLTLHCPLTPETRGLVDATHLGLMKPSAYLINTARGPIVNEADLAVALDSGVIAGAALDVLSGEPPPQSNPLLQARNIVITPHYAWATVEARGRLLATAVENVRGFLTGHPQNVVN